MSSQVAGLARARPSLRVTLVAAWWWVPASLLLSALAWPVGSLRADAVDAYWPVGLHMAALQGLEPGRDVVFTYGPLGFLAFPLLVGSATAIASFAFAAVVHTALIATVLQAARKRLPWPAALAIATVAAAAPVPLADVPVLLVLAACLRALDDPEAPGSSWLIPVGGAVAALELLVKVNDGIVCLLLLALVAWRFRPGRVRAELALAASFALSLALLWRSTHGRLSDLPQWARLCAHLLASYAQGMELPGPGRATLTAALLVAGAALLALVQARMLGRGRGTALWLAVALFAFAFFKEGFVRQDAAHTTVFYGALAVALLLVDWETPALRACALLLAAVTLGQLGSRDRLAEAVLVAVAVWLVVRANRHSLGRVAPLAAAVVVAIVVAGSLGSQPLSGVPGTTLGHAVAQVRLLASGTARAGAIAAGRAAVRERTRLSSAALAQLRGHSVDVEPYGATVAWAYGLDWQPEPLLESYAAYDPTLDRFAAASLAASGAERMLLQWSAIDGQNPLWQAPALVLTELCRYRSIGGAPGGRMVLARSADLCGTPRLVSSTDASPGAWVDVPVAAGELVYASIHFRPGLLDAARSLALRPAPVGIEARGKGGGRFGLVPATAAGPLVMRLPRLRSLPAPQGGTAIERFRIDGGGTARIDFYAVRVRGAH